ncbi:hypothetical protein BD414DRAFT_151037 [Trametes punicea]|nr:hypothetical protein BD414DRAFT_151037 [Trametes punicea]
MIQACSGAPRKPNLRSCAVRVWCFLQCCAIPYPTKRLSARPVPGCVAVDHSFSHGRSQLPSVTKNAFVPFLFSCQTSLHLHARYLSSQTNNAPSSLLS